MVKEPRNGSYYQTGKALNISDEDLLAVFATPTFPMWNSTGTKQAVSELDIRELIRSARLKALFRSHQPTDLLGAIAAYPTTALATYSGWRTKALKLANPYDYATEAVLNWSVTFVNNAGISQNGNYRIALACRILFFAMPDMMVFNFSNGLAIEKMRLQARPQAAIPHFNKYMYEGLQLNQVLLKNLVMPKPTVLSEDIWIAANKYDWWQRRVLDLALLLHFGLASATPQAQAKGMQLAARWAAKMATT